MTVLISIVTYNSARFIAKCLEGVARQTWSDYTISVIDNGSTDETVDIVKRQRQSLSLTALGKNTGFSSAHNLAMKTFPAQHVLVLNPDVYLEPTFLENILKAFSLDRSVGSASGKLLRAPASLFDGSSSSSGWLVPPYIDSTGMYFTPNQRHLDRGSNEIDTGRYEQMEYVFGASGAAALYRREMIEDVAIGGEFFDESFFAYREDADVAWRAQIMGWKCLYVPQAVAYHARRVLPENRRALPPEINMHSVKNRFLMRIKNMEVRTYLKFFLPITVRDLQVLGYVLVREHASATGLLYVARNVRRFLAARRAIQRKKRVSTEYLHQWFSRAPKAFPIQPT
jgi:GT2 family glycosyltransferase